MLTLSLLRHAKSSWADPGLDDYERPLAKRGAKAAPDTGKYLKRQKLRPDLILCSGAVRARATLDLVLAELGSPAPEVRYDDALYRTSPTIMLGALQKIGTPYRHVMMIGHNPELHALSLELIGDGRRKDIAAQNEVSDGRAGGRRLRRRSMEQNPSGLRPARALRHVWRRVEIGFEARMLAKAAVHGRRSFL